jgi:SAM-dependent MidA family methyltransferase
VIPVHLVGWDAQGMFERGVGVDHDADRFAWRDRRDVSGELQAQAAHIATTYLKDTPPMGYLTEIAPAVGGLVGSLAQSLERGAILFIDYGFRAAEFYHPSRVTGTLMCHYRHFAHPDPFLHPGLQDITAHVDFTAVADAAIAAGLTPAGYTTQAGFLLAAGLTELLAQADPRDAARYLSLTNQVQRLVSPAEMGEFFKVIAFTRGEVPVSAFAKSRPLPI